MASRFFIIGLLLFCWVPVQAQDDDKTTLIEQRIETIAENLEEGDDADYTTLFDDLSAFYDKPLNLNQATLDDLERLHLLTEFQIQALLAHIDKYGEMQSKYELQTIDGFDLPTIRNIEPFITVNPPLEIKLITAKDLLNDGQHDLFLRWTRVLEEQTGYSYIDPEELAANENRRYLGSSDRLYLRYRYKYRDILSVGFTAEKDPGEEFFTGTQKNGFDFYSGHLYYADKGWLKKVVLGDFQAQFGQGLSLWSGLAFGKSSFAMQAKRSGRGLTPYTSVDENRFMRGAGVTVGGDKLELTAFVSRKRIDANTEVLQDTLTGEDMLTLTSFQQSGLHRTPNEVADKDAILESHAGAHLRYRTRALQIGASALFSQYDVNVSRNLQLYNQYDFNSNQNMVFGVDYGWVKGNVNPFGETSRSASGGLATLNGVLIAMHPRLSISVIHRYYQREYQNLLSNGFGEGGNTNNESGIYFGMEFTMSRRWVFTGYVDQFKFPWLKYQSDKPGSGYDVLGQITFKPTRYSEFYVRYRRKVRDYNAPDDATVMDYTSPRIRQNARINARYPISKSITLRTRLEWSSYDQAPGVHEDGYLLFQDIMLKKVEWPVSFALRYALFNTPSYNSRIYAYENDLLYSWSIPAYYDEGSRFYIMAKWRVYRKIDLWVRYSRWHYSHRDSISSGLNEIQGKDKSEFRMQLRIKF